MQAVSVASRQLLVLEPFVITDTLMTNVINLSPQPWPGQENPGLGRAVAAVPLLVLLPSSAHVRPRRQLNGCRFASAGGISRFPGERVPAAVWPAFLRCSSGAACS